MLIVAFGFYAFVNHGMLHTVSYKINTKASSIEWIGKKVTGEHTGTIAIKSGNIIVDHGKIVGGGFEMDMTTITNVDQKGEWKEKLENHLKSDDFFSVDKHPVARFEITKAVPLKDDTKGSTHTITGNLTIKAITHEVSFPAKIEFHEKQLSANAGLSFDRTKWDIRHGSGKFFDNLGDKMIYDDIGITLKITASL